MADRRLKDFLDMIAAEKGAAPNTVAAYRRDVLQFLAFFGRDCALAEEDDVAAFVRDLGSRGFAPRSMARKLSAVKEFYKFLYSEDEIKTNPAAGVLSPRQEKPLPKFLSCGGNKTAAAGGGRGNGFCPLPAESDAGADVCLRSAGVRTGGAAGKLRQF